MQCACSATSGPCWPVRNTTGDGDVSDCRLRTLCLQTSSHRNNNLPELLVRLEITMSVDDLLEREDLVDHRLQHARRKAIENEALCPFQTRWIAHDLLVLVAIHGQHLAEDREQRERRRFWTQRAISEHDAALAQRIGHFLELRPEHRI